MVDRSPLGATALFSSLMAASRARPAGKAACANA